jgi:hypothetical protein
MSFEYITITKAIFIQINITKGVQNIIYKVLAKIN